METHNNHSSQFTSVRISLLLLLMTIISQPLFQTAEEYITVLNPVLTYITSRKCRNVKNLFVSLLNTAIGFDCEGYGIPFMSTVNSVGGEQETYVTMCLQCLIALVEYKPPTPENIQYLLEGGHAPLLAIRAHLTQRFKTAENEESWAEQLVNDLTINEHQRMFKVVHGRINFDPIFAGIIRFSKNVISANNSYLSGSVN